MIATTRVVALCAAALASQAVFAVSFDFELPCDTAKDTLRGKVPGVNPWDSGRPPKFAGDGQRPSARLGSLVDTLSLNPRGEHPATGWDSIPAHPSRSNGYDVGIGFAFKTTLTVQISAVDLLMRQTEEGGGLIALLYEGQGVGQPSQFKYWAPATAAKPLATFVLNSAPPSDDTAWTTVRFRLDLPFDLQPDKPYVIILDPLPEAETGKGQYGLARIPEEEGYLTAAGTPGVDVIMPSVTVRRMQYEQVVGGVKVTKALWMQQDNNWRYVVSAIVPEPASSVGVGGLLALGWVWLRRRSRHRGPARQREAGAALARGLGGHSLD